MASANPDDSANLKAYVTKSLQLGGVPELSSPCNPLPIINVTCLGVALRLPYSVYGLAEAGEKVTAQQRAELSVMIPAFSGLLRGQQAMEGPEEESMARNTQSFWSPYNEVSHALHQLSPINYYSFHSLHSLGDHPSIALCAFCRLAFTG
jgi:hypothetical protein